MKLSLLTTAAAAALVFANVAEATSQSGAAGSAGTTVSGGGATAGSGTSVGVLPGGGAAPTSGLTISGASTSGGAAVTGGEPGGGGAIINLTAEQQSQAVTALRSVSIQPVENVQVAVGQPVPTSVTNLVECPQTLRSLVTGLQDCRVILAGNRYYIVEGGSRRVVTTITRQ